MKKEKSKNPLATDHWVGMPSCENKNLGAFKKVQVNFATKEDMLKLSKIIGQPITAKTRSVWYPSEPMQASLDKRWSDKSKKK